MKWTMDDRHRVHTAWCKEVPEGALDYKVKILTGIEMLANVARPDSKDGHSAQGIASACGCVGELAEIEREREEDSK